jgi:peptidyl-prolyl cis-trans isomerase C
MTSVTTDIRRSTGNTGPAGKALFRPLLREPLLHFLMFGAVIFAVAHFVQRFRAPVERQIVVDEELQRRIVERNQAQSGITPGREQLERLVEEYIDDEVMYREAMRMGLDREDEIVRRRLIQKVQFLQRDLAAAPKPGESELRAYYAAHPQLFTSPADVTFEQLYFSADQGGWAEAEARAGHAYEQVERVTTTSIKPSDDAFPFQIPSGDLTRVDAGRLFGDTPIVDALFSTAEGRWSAPVRSAYGWHLIKIVHRRVSSTTPFDEMRGQAEAAFLQEQATAAERHELEALRARYQVLRSDKEDLRPGKRAAG